MEVIIILIVTGLVLYYLFNLVIEPAYMLLFNKPVFVHFYLATKRLPESHTALLHSGFEFYRNLSARRKRFFQHRVRSFIDTYKFVGMGLEVTAEMKLKIAATSVMLTFGMRKYLYDVFTTIIIYPEAYQSSKDNAWHKGEFNPAAKAIVFSWHDFEEGLQYGNDNLNLGLHEFAHALHFDSLRLRRPGASATVYKDMFGKIMEYISSPQNRERLIAANYFRGYAYTNQYEFLAVLLEYFFETPREFRQKLPDLYELVRKMINFREG